MSNRLQSVSLRCHLILNSLDLKMVAVLSYEISLTSPVDSTLYLDQYVVTSEQTEVFVNNVYKSSRRDA